MHDIPTRFPRTVLLSVYFGWANVHGNTHVKCLVYIPSLPPLCQVLCSIYRASEGTAKRRAWSLLPTPNAGKDPTKDPEEADKQRGSVLKTKRLLKPRGPKSSRIKLSPDVTQAKRLPTHCQKPKDQSSQKSPPPVKKPSRRRGPKRTSLWR